MGIGSPGRDLLVVAFVLRSLVTDAAGDNGAILMG